MKLQLLDELIFLGHGTIRSTDCLLAIKLKSIPELQIKRAQEIFPKTASHPIPINDYSSIDDFLKSDLKDPFHLEIGIIREETLVALKMSHVIGDGVSMLLFLKAMLGHEVSAAEIELKSFPKKKDTPYRKILNSQLWPRKGKKSRKRSFLCESFVHGEKNGPAWNNLMLYALLEALPYQRKSIWMPVNVRKKFWEGFGNGLSRMRVYPPEGENLDEKLVHIRRQKHQAMKNGEVALPPPGLDIHDWRQKFLYDIWVRRPWADWGSISFSHMANSRGFLDGLESVWGISSIMPAQNGAIFAVTNGGKTDFTLSYDPALVNDEEARILLRDFLFHLRAKLEV